MTSVIGVKHKWLWSVPDEMQVSDECLVSARLLLPIFWSVNRKLILQLNPAWHDECVVEKSNWFSICNMNLLAAPLHLDTLTSTAQGEQYEYLAWTIMCVVHRRCEVDWSVIHSRAHIYHYK